MHLRWNIIIVIIINDRWQQERMQMMKNTNNPTTTISRGKKLQNTKHLKEILWPSNNNLHTEKAKCVMHWENVVRTENSTLWNWTNEWPKRISKEEWKKERRKEKKKKKKERKKKHQLTNNVYEDTSIVHSEDGESEFKMMTMMMKMKKKQTKERKKSFWQ